MAQRIMYVGDSTPAALFELSDKTGVLNLSSATSIEAMFIGQTYQFNGPATSIWPAQADPDGIHNWNCSYSFALGDTRYPDIYVPYVQVAWSSGEVQTFATTDTLRVLPLLVLP